MGLMSERLASGLSHEPSVVVSRLNVAAEGNKMSETSQFVGGVLGVQQLPTLLLYPEASPGVMRYQGKRLTAEAILDSLNRCYEQVLPHRPNMVLLGVPGPEDMFPQQDPPPEANTSAQAQSVPTESSTVVGSTSSPPGRRSSSSVGGSDVHRSSAGAEDGVRGEDSSSGGSVLLPPGTPDSTSGQQQPSSSTSTSTSSNGETGQGWRRRRKEGSRGETGVSAHAGADVWQPPHQSYWTGEKVLLWGSMLLLSVGAFVWERWLGPRAELQGLKKRQAARAAGYGNQFDEDTNLDDLWRLKTLRSTPEGAALLAKYVGDGGGAAAPEASNTETEKGLDVGQEADGPGRTVTGGRLAGLNGVNGVGQHQAATGGNGDNGVGRHGLNSVGPHGLNGDNGMGPRQAATGGNLAGCNGADGVGARS
ncbi:hypothetical protein DUNSADRAFT_8013 [Dunaliella salina]|uniref:Uncharacterized protein n=1 Tax=Dunaliella salina TaxID=3046 RepID=A0ABQ7GK56_DUNSA|nr:hypothetical protein DUNSADRAFT_8013 [Dunaliella salina]|eukprot:KAF5835010.1 hypothetical protein DUNSADRAFT_8013 [Dunaliella salina]